MPFPFEEYERMAAMMRVSKGKVMVSINDHIDIRRVFDDFPRLGLSITYTVNNTVPTGTVTGRELVIANWELGTQTTGLF
ncbi:hypothetical protein [Paraburkholderia fungorum]|uniref:hypothetical protein n=1 Tax=Paraburkholderia fungorum TaxID=134537 RepID=UPI0009428126